MQRYTGGYKVFPLSGPFHGGFMLLPQSEERETITFESVDLENPVGLRLANCQTKEEFLSFCNRFDDGSFNLAFMNGATGPAESIGMREAWSVALCSEPSMEAVNRSGVNAQLDQIARSMLMPGGDPVSGVPETPIGPQATLRPQVRVVDGRPRLVLETLSMRGFMMLELAAAIEAGVTAVACEHCDKLFLFGPLTGRRSHGRFCSDRCRVAAMRARNAAKGASQ